MPSATAEIAGCCHGETRFELANRLFFRLYQCANMLHKVGTRAVESEGLTTQRWAVLGALPPPDRDPGMSVGDLARYLAVSRQSLAGVVNHLEREGLIAGTPRPARRTIAPASPHPPRIRHVERAGAPADPRLLRRRRSGPLSRGHEPRTALLRAPARQHVSNRRPNPIHADIADLRTEERLSIPPPRSASSTAARVGERDEFVDALSVLPRTQGMESASALQAQNVQALTIAATTIRPLRGVRGVEVPEAAERRSTTAQNREQSLRTSVPTFRSAIDQEQTRS